MKTVTFVLCVLTLGIQSLLVLGDCPIDGRNLKAGETYQPADRCVLHTCESNGFLTGKTCSSGSSLKPCKIVQDVSLPYPQCCPSFDCDNKD